MFRTIRSRLALWNFFIIFFILAWFGVAFYANFAHKIRFSADHDLRWSTEWVMDQLQFREGQLEFVNNGIRSIEDLVIHIQDDQGNILLDWNGALDYFPARLSRQKDLVGLIWDANHVDGTLYRTLLMQEELDEDDGFIGEPLQLWVLVAKSQTEIEADLLYMRWNLIGISIFLLVVANGLTLLLTGRLLRPLKQMAHSADEISEKNLDQRLPIPNPKDETGQLGLAFNRLFERLHDAFESQRRFVADASHELRTPLTVLKGKLEVALGKQRSADEYMEVIQTSLVQTNRLSELVQRLLLLARADAGRLEAEKKPVNLAQLVEQIRDQIHPLMSQKQLQFNVDFKAHPIVIGDQELLNQAVLNLLENAIKYTPDGGTVSLSLDMGQQDAVLKVTDTGTGIAKEELDQVFERFYRVDRARSVTIPGLGLGLSIVSEIVTHHEGLIHIDSQLNQGTCVEVRLPLKQSEPTD